MRVAAHILRGNNGKHSHLNLGDAYESPCLAGLPRLMSASTHDTRPIVLLTCNPFETRAVIHYFCRDEEPQFKVVDGHEYLFLRNVAAPETPSEDRQPIYLVRSRQGSMRAFQTLTSAVIDLEPQLIIGVGIAFGVNEEEQGFADVLVSDSMIEVEHQRVNADGTRDNRGAHIPASEPWLRRMQLRCDMAHGHPWPKIRRGCLMSGAKLVDDLDYRNEKLRQFAGYHPFGGEMEAAGIAALAEERHVSWLVVKAICDFGKGLNHPKKDAIQEMAARRAARVVYTLLTRDYPEEPLECVEGVSNDPDKTSGIDAPRPLHEPMAKDYWAIPNERRLDVQTKVRDFSAPFLGPLTPSLPANEDEQSEGDEVVTDIMTWLSDPDGKPIFAIFGDFGAGKTVACQAVALRQWNACVEGSAELCPLYFDLRRVQVANGIAPTLTETMVACARRGWKQSDEISGAEIWELINNGALVIFDGLDEVLTKLNEAAGQIYIDDLLSVASQAKVTPRVLVSSRTQFFRSNSEERNRLTGSQHQGTDVSKFEARWLLPLQPSQIAKYLEAALPDMDLKDVQEMISEVHDLSDLTRRPFTLRMIAKVIPEISKARAEGKTVNASILYRDFATQWLDRDVTKRHIKPEHKMYLAEELAADLWRSGKSNMPVEKLEEWFNAWKKNRPGWDIYDEVGREKLEEDLRNSTFLTREGTSADEDAFQFAHTSLAEFFLSEYMLRALEENAPERWALRPPSEETYGFLGMSLAEKDESTRQELLTTMGSWFAGTDGTINAAILSYRLYAGWGGLPQVTLPLIRSQVESLSVGGARRLLKTMRKGDHVCVGGYSWTLLDKDSKTALLLCDQIVDYQPYNTEFAKVTWQTCTLRTWLNRDFLATFPQDFQDALAFVDASSKKAEVVTSADDSDKLFLLSLEEAKKNPLTDETRIAHRHDGRPLWWWLRSVGASRGLAPLVIDGGTLSVNGLPVRCADYGVRPALKMNL